MSSYFNCRCVAMNFYELGKFNMYLDKNKSHWYLLRTHWTKLNQIWLGVVLEYFFFWNCVRQPHPPFKDGCHYYDQKFLWLTIIASYQVKMSPNFKCSCMAVFSTLHPSCPWIFYFNLFIPIMHTCILILKKQQKNF